MMDAIWSGGGKANDFDRTEATDLLKTKDGARDRTQYEPILEGSQGGSTVEGLFRVGLCGKRLKVEG